MVNGNDNGQIPAKHGLAGSCDLTSEELPKRRPIPYQYSLMVTGSGFVRSTVPRNLGLSQKHCSDTSWGLGGLRNRRKDHR
jgi:hypothetical protein